MRDHDALERAITTDWNARSRSSGTCTANVAGFRRLAERRELHAGIVFIVDGGLVRNEQFEVLRRVIGALEQEREMINRVLSVRLDGELVIEEILSDL